MFVFFFEDFFRSLRMILMSKGLKSFATLLHLPYATYTALKESVFGVILVRIFPAFFCIGTEYGEMPTRITPNTDSFYAVIVSTNRKI